MREAEKIVFPDRAFAIARQAGRFVDPSFPLAAIGGVRVKAPAPCARMLVTILLMLFAPSRGRSRVSAKALLVPAMAEQGENDDQAVEELHIEAAEARRDDAALDERDDQCADRPAGDRADAAPCRRAAAEGGGHRRHAIAG